MFLIPKFLNIFAVVVITLNIQYGVLNEIRKKERVNPLIAHKCKETDYRDYKIGWNKRLNEKLSEKIWTN